MSRVARFPRATVAIAFAIAAIACGPRAYAQVTDSSPTEHLAGEARPLDEQTAIDDARKLVAAGDLPGAVKTLSGFVGAHPHDLEAARYLGDLYYRQSDFASAEKTYRAILVVAPNDTMTHDRLGGIYAAQDRVPEAIEEFGKSLPETSAYGHLVDLHRRAGDLQKFEDTYKYGALEKPDDAGAQFALGAIYEAERKPADAIPYLEASLHIEPGSCTTMAWLGDAYLDLGRTDSAIDVLKRCLVLNHDDYPALVNLGATYIQLHQFDKASELLQHANRIMPDGPEALVDLGYLQDVALHEQAAVGYYLRAIGVDPLARDAYVDLGYDYEEQHLYALAEAAFLKGLSVVPNDGRLHYLLGLTYADQGKHDLARQEYERATKSDEPEIANAAIRDLQRLQ